MGTMIFTSSCAGCRRPGPVLCRTCRLVLAAPPAMPTSGDVIAAVPFVGRSREVILGLKYGNRRQLGHHLAGLVVNRILAAGIEPDDIDVVTWAPTSSSRRHRRGFDQAELVARRVALQLGVPCRRLLRRDGAAPPQTGLDRAMRLHGPMFTANPSVAGRRVLVVDDVVTTGSTLRSAARALEQAGAIEVRKAAVATTPAIVTRQQVGSPRARRRNTESRTVVHGPRAA
jgi:ComF family protein